MRGRLRFAAAMLSAVLLGMSQAGASVSFDLTPVDNSAVLSGYVTYDLQVTTDTDWISAAMLLDLSAGGLYQHAQGADTGPTAPSLMGLDPAVAFDTHVAGSIAGGAGDLGGTALTFGTDRLDVSWFNMTWTDIGTTTIGRLTLTEDAAGSMSLLTGGQRFDVVFAPGVGPAVTAVIEEVEEVEEVEAPSGTGTWVDHEIVSISGSRDYGKNLDAWTDWPRLWQPRESSPVNEMNELYRSPSLDDYLAPRLDRHERYSELPGGYINTLNSFSGREAFTEPAPDGGLPEPGTLILLGTCVGAAALRRRVR